MDPLTIAIFIMVLSLLSGVLRIWAYLKPKSILIDHQKATNQNDDTNVQPNDPISPHPVLISRPNTPLKTIPNPNHDISPTPKPLFQSPIPIKSPQD